MKIFRKPDKKLEVTDGRDEEKGKAAGQGTGAGDGEVITVFKEERRRKASIQAKGKHLSTH